MHRWSLWLLLVSACGGSSGPASLQGPGSFAPNSVLVFDQLLSDGGIERDWIDIGFSRSSPAYVCAFLDGGVPSSLTYQGDVELYVAQNDAVVEGTVPVTDNLTFSELVSYPAAGIAFVELYGAIDAFDPNPEPYALSIGGSLTLTKVGNEWAGSFTATMLAIDGGQSSLSGSFDTGSTCYYSYDPD